MVKCIQFFTCLGGGEGNLTPICRDRHNSFRRRAQHDK